MEYVLNYNRLGLSPGQVIELPEAEGEFLKQHGFVSDVESPAISEEVEVTESPAEMAEDDESETDLNG